MNNASMYVLICSQMKKKIKNFLGKLVNEHLHTKICPDYVQSGQTCLK